MLFAESETWPQVVEVAEIIITQGNFYMASNIARTPSPPSARVHNYDQPCLYLLQYPLATINMLQQVIAGLAACQTSTQDLLKIVESSKGENQGPLDP